MGGDCDLGGGTAGEVVERVKLVLGLELNVKQQVQVGNTVQGARQDVAIE